MQNKRQNLSKPEQSAKTNFFEALTCLRSKNVKLPKDAYIYKEYAKQIADLNHGSISFGISYSEQKKSVPAQSSQYSIILTLETFLGTTKKKSKDTNKLLQK